ncbi:MAG: hypothetical protein HUU49_02420 [Candidatus Buchananbacteria bacterium]|nr:hypothetical protein [Candidatus Buchananbacteria bacterium]
MPGLDRLERQGEPIFAEEENPNKVLDAISLLEQLGPNPNVYELPTGDLFRPYADAAETFISAFNREDKAALDNKQLKRLAEEIRTVSTTMSKEVA